MFSNNPWLYSVLSHSSKLFSFFTSYFNIFLDSTSSSLKASSNYVPPDSTPTSSNETTVCFIKRCNINWRWRERTSRIKKAPAPLTNETRKQDEINKQINVENEVLVVLYKKKELNRMMENNLKEFKTWQANL